jgi:HSP20 family protein
MLMKKQAALAPTAAFRDPFTLLKQMTSEFDRLFSEPAWPIPRFFRTPPLPEGTKWVPGVDVFEKDNRLVTKIDLPGMKKEDVKVEVSDGYLTISGERKSEAEEEKEQFYRCEREYGSFYRAVPLPENVKLDDVKATFADGVLEVSVPVPAKAVANVHKVEIQDAPRAAKAA